MCVQAHKECTPQQQERGTRQGPPGQRCVVPPAAGHHAELVAVRVLSRPRARRVRRRHRPVVQPVGLSHKVATARHGIACLANACRGWRGGIAPLPPARLHHAEARRLLAQPTTAMLCQAEQQSRRVVPAPARPHTYLRHPPPDALRMGPRCRVRPHPHPRPHTPSRTHFQMLACGRPSLWPISWMR